MPSSFRAYRSGATICMPALLSGSCADAARFSFCCRSLRSRAPASSNRDGIRSSSASAIGPGSLSESQATSIAWRSGGWGHIDDRFAVYRIACGLALPQRSWGTRGV
jgi:hypothetical protein